MAEIKVGQGLSMQLSFHCCCISSGHSLRALVTILGSLFVFPLLVGLATVHGSVVKGKVEMGHYCCYYFYCYCCYCFYCFCFPSPLQLDDAPPVNPLLLNSPQLFSKITHRGSSLQVMWNKLYNDATLELTHFLVNFCMELQVLS